MNRSSRRLLLALLVAALMVYLVNLGDSTIWDANEAYYVETPREMLESGDYVNPSFNYEPRFNKPVLSYWVVAGLYHVSGVSVTTERVAIAIMAFLMLAASFVLGRAASGDAMAGLLATIGLAAGPRFFLFGRRILIDVANSAAMSWILVFFALSELYPIHRRRFLYLMYVTVGIGLLTKGPVAAVLPALVFFAYLAAHGEIRRLGDMLLIQGVIIVVLIAAPWYALLYAQHGWVYITGFFVGENVDRYLSPVGPQDGRGVWFYLPVLLTDSFPWSVTLAGAVATWWSGRRLGGGDPRGRMRTLLLLWCGVITLFFSLSQTKQDLYIFPVTPAIAALGGWFVHQLLSHGAPSGRRWFAGTFSVIAAILCALGVLVIAMFVRAGSAYSLDGALLVGTVVSAGGLVVAWLAWRDRRLLAVACTLATLVAANWILALRALPAFEQYKPVAPLSVEIARQMRPGDVVAHFDVSLPSMTYYLQRHIDVMFDEDAFLATMRSGKRVFAVLPAGRYEQLRSALAGSCVVARHKTADVKLENVLDGTAPSEIVVVLSPCLVS